MNLAKAGSPEQHATNNTLRRYTNKDEKPEVKLSGIKNIPDLEHLTQEMPNTTPITARKHQAGAGSVNIKDSIKATGINSLLINEEHETEAKNFKTHKLHHSKPEALHPITESEMISSAPLETDKKNTHENSEVEAQLSCYIQEKKIPRKYLDTLTRIISSEEKELNDIPEKDLKNMLRSLNFSDVSTEDDCFDAYNIKLIKTGAVFFTWKALGKTSIFNGRNNLAKIDYVTHIINTAKNLRESKHPVLVIYSNDGMPEGCIEEMDSYFSEEDNIITLCKERDLGLNFTNISKSDIHANDHIRLEILTSQDKVLEKSMEQARKAGKTSVLKLLQSCQASSLIYSDMDNHFNTIFPDYLIAFDGAINTTQLVTCDMDENALKQFPLFSLLDDIRGNSFKLDSDDINTSKVNKELFSIIKDLFQNRNKDSPAEQAKNTDQNPKIEKLYNIAMTMKKNKVTQIAQELQKYRLQDELDQIHDSDIYKKTRKTNSYFHKRENSFIVCSYPENDKLKATFDKSSKEFTTRIDFHSDKNKKNDKSIADFYNCHHRKANNLTGYQLIDYVIFGNDNSYNTGCTFTSIELLLNRKELPEANMVKINTKYKSTTITYFQRGEAGKFQAIYKISGHNK